MIQRVKYQVSDTPFSPENIVEVAGSNLSQSSTRLDEILLLTRYGSYTESEEIMLYKTTRNAGKLRYYTFG
jgi:hypothetical protein